MTSTLTTIAAALAGGTIGALAMGLLAAAAQADTTAPAPPNQDHQPCPCGQPEPAQSPQSSTSQQPTTPPRPDTSSTTCGHLIV